jgi:ATP-dependent protease Clp ATPase subunit
MICCDFCGTTQYAARKVIVGNRPGTGEQVAICDRCIRLAMEIVEKELCEPAMQEGRDD